MKGVRKADCLGEEHQSKALGSNETVEILLLSRCNTVLSVRLSTFPTQKRGRPLWSDRISRLPPRLRTRPWCPVVTGLSGLKCAVTANY